MIPQLSNFDVAFLLPLELLYTAHFSNWSWTRLPSTAGDWQAWLTLPLVDTRIAC